ncbi:MAG: PAS domain S-box protein [archaeon]
MSKGKRRRAEDEKAVSEDYVKKMKDTYPIIIRTLMHDLIVSFDKDGDIVFLNDAAVEFWGQPSEELIGTHFYDYLHLEDTKKTQVALQEIIKSKGQVKGLIVRVKSPKGERTVAWNAAAIFDDTGEYVGIQATGKDLTDLLHAEKKLKWSQKHFQRLFEAMVDPVVIVDKNGNILEFSQSAEEILGVPKEELIGKHFSETRIVTEKSKDILMKNLKKGKNGKYVAPFTIEAVTKEGKMLLYEASTAKLIYKGEPATLGIFHNITEQKKTEEKLRESEERFNYFIENAPEAIWVQDVAGIFLDGNKRAEKLTGYTKEELIGKNMLDILVSPESITRLMEAFTPNKLGKKSGPNEVEMIRKDGSRVSVEASIIPVERDGRIEIIGITRDITERKKAEKALQESEKRLRELTDLLPEIIFETDATGKFVFVNQVAYERFGYTQEDFDNGLKTVQMLIPEDRNRAKDEFDRVLSGADVGFLEFTGLSKEGSTFPIMIHVTPIIRGNMPVGLRGIIVDITEHKKTESRLKESLQRFQTIFEGATDGIIAINPKTMKFAFANPRMSEIIGYSSNELLKMSVTDLFRKEDLPFYVGQVQKHFENEIEVTRDIPILRKDKQIVYCTGSSRLMKLGNQEYLVGFVKDVTEQKKIENELKQSEQRFRAIFEGATDGILAADAETLKFAFANPRMEEITGYPIDELLNLNVTDLDRKEALPVRIKQFTAQLEGKSIFTRNAHILRKDKTVVYCDVSSRFLNIGDKQYVVGFFRDVTERRHTEEELIRLSNAVRMSNESIVITDLDGKVVDINEASLKLYGIHDKKELIGKSSLDIIKPEERKKAFAIIKEAMKKRSVSRREYTITLKDGTKTSIEMSTSVMKDKDGKPIGFVTINRDITERKKAEEKLRESEEKYREMINGMNDTALILDFDTNIIDVNQTAVDVLGYSREELLIMKVHQIDSSLTPEAIQDLGKKMEKSELLVFETVHTARGGRTFPVEISATRVTYQGKPAILSIARDITERKKAEEALRNSEMAARRLLEFQNKVIDTATVWVNLIDLKGNVVLWNRAAELVSGYSREEVVGTNKMWKLLYPNPDYRTNIFAIGKKILEEGKRMEDFYSIIRCKDGTMKTISWYSTNILNEKGEPEGSISIGIDVTEREKDQQEMKKAFAMLKQSNSDLESYTYVVSHDLKAPLRTIRSFGSFILEDYSDKLDDTGKDYLNRMINASSHLNTMIEDLLVLSRVGREFTEREKVDLNKLVNEIVTDFEATIKEQNAKIVVDKLPVLSAQKVWMRQLFMNVISNALKFNESKTPKIEVLYEETENDHLFKIQDNGIGIEEKYLERIFNLFERASTDKNYEGTGAGLAICKRIVMHLGGKIWVESTLGKGSTFFFTIPKKGAK